MTRLKRCAIAILCLGCLGAFLWLAGAFFHRNSQQGKMEADLADTHTVHIYYGGWWTGGEHIEITDRKKIAELINALEVASVDLPWDMPAHEPRARHLIIFDGDDKMAHFQLLKTSPSLYWRKRAWVRLKNKRFHDLIQALVDEHAGQHVELWDTAPKTPASD